MPSPIGTSAVPEPEVHRENGGWTLLLVGAPVAADATIFDEAVADFIEALREYADDWVDDEGMHRGLSHYDNGPLVHFIQSSTDQHLRAWVSGIT